MLFICHHLTPADSGPRPVRQPPHNVYLGDVGLRGQADHDVQLLQLDVDGVVVLHEEHLDLLLQDLRPGGNT